MNNFVNFILTENNKTNIDNVHYPLLLFILLNFRKSQSREHSCTNACNSEGSVEFLRDNSPDAKNPDNMDDMLFLGNKEKSLTKISKNSNSPEIVRSNSLSANTSSKIGSHNHFLELQERCSKLFINDIYINQLLPKPSEKIIEIAEDSKNFISRFFLYKYNDFYIIFKLQKEVCIQNMQNVTIGDCFAQIQDVFKFFTIYHCSDFDYKEKVVNPYFLHKNSPYEITFFKNFFGEHIGMQKYMVFAKDKYLAN